MDELAEDDRPTLPSPVGHGWNSAFDDVTVQFFATPREAEDEEEEELTWWAEQRRRSLAHVVGFTFALCVAVLVAGAVR